MHLIHSTPLFRGLQDRDAQLQAAADERLQMRLSLEAVQTEVATSRRDVLQLRSSLEDKENHLDRTHQQMRKEILSVQTPPSSPAKTADTSRTAEKLVKTAADLRRQLAASVAECEHLRALSERVDEQDAEQMLEAELESKLQPMIEKTHELREQLAKAKSQADADRHARRELESSIATVRKGKAAAEKSLRLSQNQLDELGGRLQTADESIKQAIGTARTQVDQEVESLAEELAEAKSQCDELVSVSASQYMQQLCNIFKRDGPNHLGLWFNQASAEDRAEASRKISELTVEVDISGRHKRTINRLEGVRDPWIPTRIGVFGILC